MSDSEQWVELGRINGVFGVKGWVKVFSFTRPRDEILKYNPWYLLQDGAWVAHKITGGKLQGSNIVIGIDGCDDRDKAKSFQDVAVAVRADQLPKVDQDEFYWRDLVGLEVENTEGESLGKVEDVMETGANDVLILSEERLIPFTHEAVLSVDLQSRKVLVEWDSDF
ncbi:MAG: 16S rRNA processing protein RimM [Parasphingorhabdus sp.]|jgi:16S rRNA processing protein RimM